MRLLVQDEPHHYGRLTPPQEIGDGPQGNGGGAVDREAVRAGRDGGQGDGAAAALRRGGQDVLVDLAQLPLDLRGVALVVVRADGVDDVAGREVSGAGD